MDNLSPLERDELQRLRSDASITISPADKGGMWVIMPTEKYNAEALRQLCDTRRYRCVTEDIDRATGLRLSNLLQHLYRRNFITARELRGLLPRDDYKPRRFYILPKIHKDLWPDVEMPPGRPIVNDVNSVSRPCASLIEHFLAPLAQQAPSYIRDSLHFLALIRDATLPTNSVLFTLDVKDLYSNIPINEGLSAVADSFRSHPDPKRPDLTLLSMLRVLLLNNCFTFNGQRYLQLMGTPMGGAYSGSLANIYMNHWEMKTNTHPLQPRFWYRYIDDIIGAWDHGLDALNNYVAFLNTIDPCIQLVLCQHQHHIRYLDLELYRFNTSLRFRVGFKPTDSHNILPTSSHHPRHIFTGVLYSQVLRWASRSYTYNDFLLTKRTVTPNWRRQGYTRSAIRTAIHDVFNITRQSQTSWLPGFFPCDSYCSICRYATCSYTFKDNISNNAFYICHRLQCTDNNTIYIICCKKCDQTYVGQTSRQLKRRISEHLSDIKHQRKTSVSDHFNNCDISSFSFFAIEHVPDTQRRLAKEAVWIERLHSTPPTGFNIAEDSLDVNTALVLPHSSCATRTFQLCRTFSMSSSRTRVTCAKRRSKNLKELFKK